MRLDPPQPLGFVLKHDGHSLIVFDVPNSNVPVRVEGDDFLSSGIVAFNDTRIGKLSPTVTKEELLALYAKHYPEEKEGSRASWASQVLRLISEMAIGDDVATWDASRRFYVIGKITSEYEWVPRVGKSAHARRVTWSHETPRDALSAATRNTLGSVLTVFKLNADAEKDLLSHAVPLGAEPTVVAPKPKEAAKNAEVLLEISEETFEKADSFIEDQIDGLTWEQMQELVAGILRAMGYRTTVSPPGPDRGVDVFASRDGLGLEEPRIFVEVKHRTATMGAKEIRAFVGGRRKGDKCLYVSTGGFSKDALFEADRADVAVTLITLPKLRQLVVDFYEKLDPETRALVPLRRLYWPVVEKGG